MKRSLLLLACCLLAANALAAPSSIIPTADQTLSREQLSSLREQTAALQAVQKSQDMQLQVLQQIQQQQAQQIQQQAELIRLQQVAIELQMQRANSR